MGVDLGSLLRSGMAGAIGRRQGLQDADEYQQKALRELLAQRLQAAQIGNYEAQAAQRLAPKPARQPTTVFTDKGLLQYNEATNEWDPAPIKGGGVAGKPVDPKEPRAPGHLDPLSPQGIAAAVSKERQIAETRKQAGGRMTDAKLRAQSFGQTLTRLNPGIRAYEQANVKPSAVAETVGAIPYVGNLGRTGANYLRSPQQRQYRTLADQWSIAVLRPESGAVIPPQELDSYFRIYFKQPGDDAETVRLKQAARQDKEREAQIRGGLQGGGSPDDAAPDVPEEVGGPAAPTGKRYRPDNPYASQP